MRNKMNAFNINRIKLDISKIYLSIFLLGAYLVPQVISAQSVKQWKLVWEDNFNEATFDTNTWSKIPRGKPDWKNTMSDDERLFEVRDGKLILRGIATGNNDDPYLTGGLWTKGKHAFIGGKLEIRAKLNSGRGAWPAIWLMPFKQKKAWPLEGEIDIMEHLNYDNVVYQTVHSNYTQNLGGKAGSHKTSHFKANEFNTFGVEMQEEKLIFYINGVKTFEYKRNPSLESKGQFPFYREMHLILSMQLGGSWVGKVNPQDLPIEMEIDWVRHYQKESIPSDGAYPTWNEVDYPREGDKRIVQSLSIKGATLNQQPLDFTTIVAGANAESQNKIVFDNTQDVLQASIGDELTLSPKVKDLTWMHYYLYIDYNQNKQFDANELVSYSAYKKDGQWRNSKGVKVRNNDVPKEMPSFIIPKTAKQGKTRARFKVDWNNISPTGNMNPNNLLSKNQGTICDFSINIHQSKHNTSLESINDKKRIILYPNPTSKAFKIAGLDNIKSISIYSVNGCLVKEFRAIQKEYPVGNLSNGSYILSINTTEGHYSRELLIKH